MTDCTMRTSLILSLILLTAAKLSAQQPRLILPIGHTDGIESASFSPDGKKIVTASGDHTAKVWDGVTGKLLADLAGHTDGVESASFSPDGKKIVTASSDNTAKLWDGVTGKLLLDLAGHNSAVISASFSPDGKKIVTASGDNTAKVWDGVTGKLLTDLAGHTIAVCSASFSPDGKKIVTASYDNTAKVWDGVTGKLLLDLAGHTSWVTSASFSPDGKKIVTASEDNTAKLWDGVTGKLLLDLAGHTSWFTSASFSPDGKKIVTALGDNTAKVWDGVTGKLLLDLAGHTSAVISASFSPDGKKIVTASLDATPKVWDGVTGKLLTDLTGHTIAVYSASFSPDGKKIVTVSRDNTAKVWDGATGKLLTDLTGHTKSVESASFSPDGKKIVTASGDNTAKVWDGVTGKLLLDLAGHTNSVYFACFSPDGKKIVTASEDNTAKVWDGVTGKLLLDLAGHTYRVYSASFSPDGKNIVTASLDDTPKVWDAETGELITDLAGHTNQVISASFSPDGKNIVTASLDNTCKIWGAISGELLYTFFAVDTADYLVVDKNFRYDGSEGARKFLYFVCGDEVIELDQVKDQLWVPNLGERILKKDSINAVKLSDLNICGLTPLVEELSDKPGFYRYRITPRRGGLGETVLFVNNNPTYRFKKNELTAKDGVYELTIPADQLKPYFVSGSTNPIKVKAFTADNTISSRGLIVDVTTTKIEAVTPNLYAVMVGVSDYKGQELKLKYAAKDANDLSSVIALSAKKLLNGDGKEHVFVYNLTTAENRYRFPEKMAVKQVLEEIGKKATANDILLIFFAGHGVMTGEADKKQFYFLTAEASSLATTSAVQDVGISTTELSEWINPKNLKAQKRVLIFDACNSGQAINDMAGKELAVRNDDKSQQIKAIDKLNEKSGLFVLSAAASNQSAYEMGRYAQGLLTYSLLKAVKQQPEILENGKYLNLSRWFNAAVETVNQLSKENGARQEPQVVSNTNFNVGLVDNDVITKIVLPQEKPLFAASNFQNSDESIADDDLEVSKIINLQLADIASRGSESKIVYVTATNSTDAWSLSGRYEVKGDEIIVKANLKQNKEIKQRFEVKGTKDKLYELAAAVAEKAAGMVSESGDRGRMSNDQYSPVTDDRSPVL